jgi:alpha-acetolactate decarboxylase
MGLITLTTLLSVKLVSAADADTWDGKLVQYGRMHEAIGQQQHHARVELGKLVERPHFYGVAALANLEGEATILDGRLTLTCVDDQGRLAPSDDPSDQSATLLVGAYVPAWSEQRATSRVNPNDLDNYIADAAAKAGIDASEPFVFTAEGQFSDLRMHVINGACPMHARLRKIELPKEKQALEVELDKVRGTLVGVYAKDQVGNITHPDTATHMHLVFTDSASGKTVTGHVEQIGLQEGAVLRLPRTK